MKSVKGCFPKIRVDNAEITKENGIEVITENIGKYGYFELKP